MSVSAIIPTRNRADSLARTLQAFAGLDLPDGVPFELIVVDNGSTDGTQAVVEAFQRSATFPVRHVPEPRPGVSGARNLGAAQAVGTLLLFTDDDCLVASDWVRGALAIFADGAPKLVGGRVDLADPAHLPLAVKASGDAGRLCSAGELIGFLHSANLAVPRNVWERLGGFDPLLGPPFFAGEDADLAYRALLAGITVLYDPRLRLRHDHRRMGEREWYRQNFAYAGGCGAIMMKHLLAGRTDMVRMNYWDVRSALRKLRDGEVSWRWLWAKRGIGTGAAGYLLGAARRRVGL